MSLLSSVEALWQESAGVAIDFRPGEVTVVVTTGSQWCPPGWSGLVRLGTATAVTVPDVAAAERVRRVASRFGRLDRDALQEDGVTAFLGPARLDYLDRSAFRPVDGVEVEQVDKNDPGVAALLAATGDDAHESGIAGITSPAFVVRVDDEIVSVSGYNLWLRSTAHMCLLSHPDHRGRGWAGAVASAATQHALAARLLPQWRARITPSHRIAGRLGYEPIGYQLSFAAS